MIFLKKDFFYYFYYCNYIRNKAALNKQSILKQSMILYIEKKEVKKK